MIDIGLCGQVQNRLRNTRTSGRAPSPKVTPTGFGLWGAVSVLQTVHP